MLTKRAFLLVGEFAQKVFLSSLDPHPLIIIQIVDWCVGPRSRTQVGSSESSWRSSPSSPGAFQIQKLKFTWFFCLNCKTTKRRNDETTKRRNDKQQNDETCLKRLKLKDSGSQAWGGYYNSWHCSQTTKTVAFPLKSTDGMLNKRELKLGP